MLQARSGESRALDCMRCNGRMTLERFGSLGNYFFGMRCLLCGDVVDPVILLHRLSEDTKLAIPDSVAEIILMIEKCMSSASQPL